MKQTAKLVRSQSSDIPTKGTSSKKKTKPRKDQEEEPGEVRAIGEEEEEEEEDEEEEEEEVHKVGGKRKRSKPQEFDASSPEAVEKSLKVAKQKAKLSAAQQFKPPAR